jgi:RNA polymerase sigma factor for flagellar operon FliA
MQGQIRTRLSQPRSTSETEPEMLTLLPLVRSIARRLHSRMPKNVDVDDIVSAGLLGLVEASAKFDPAKKVPFVNYASFRIRGAILDSLRQADWAPRALRCKARKVQEAMQTLIVRLGRAPLEDEVATELTTSLHAYQKLLTDLDSLKPGTLYRMNDDTSGNEEEVCASSRPEDNPLACSIRAETKRWLAGAIQHLSEKERQVITLYYFEELTLNQISLVLHKSTSGVNWLRTSAVCHLRSALSDPPLRRARFLHASARARQSH